MTYGERMLGRLDFKLARRRRLVLLVPAAILAVWASADLGAARHGRLDVQGAGLLRHVADHAALAAWTLLVVGAFATALKPRRAPGAALVAILAGPVLTPVIFRGGGGWHAWQIGFFLLVTLPALAPRRRR